MIAELQMFRIKQIGFLALINSAKPGMKKEGLFVQQLKLSCSADHQKQSLPVFVLHSSAIHYELNEKCFSFFKRFAGRVLKLLIRPDDLTPVRLKILFSFTWYKTQPLFT